MDRRAIADLITLLTKVRLTAAEIIDTGGVLWRPVDDKLGDAVDRLLAMLVDGEECQSCTSQMPGRDQ